MIRILRYSIENLYFYLKYLHILLMSLRLDETLKSADHIEPGEPPVSLSEYKAPMTGPLSYSAHDHEFAELVVTMEGRGRHIVGDRSYEVSGGDVFVIPPGVKHEFIGLEAAHHWNVMFHTAAFGTEKEAIEALPGYRALFVLEPSLRQRRSLEYRFHLDADRLDTVGCLFVRMAQEHRLRPPGYRIMLPGLFRELIIVLARSYDEQDQSQTRQVLRISRAIGFIEKHYADPIGLDSICRAAAVSRPTMNRHFREIMDTSPCQYLMRFRIHKAADLLRETDINVTQIAFAVGFNDGNHFSSSFSRLMGHSPRAFRQHLQKSSVPPSTRRA